MPVLNVDSSADLSSALNISQLRNHNSLNSNVNLNRNRIIHLLFKGLTNDSVTIGQGQRLIGRKYGIYMFNRNNIAILNKYANDYFIYILCLYIKNTLDPI